jgi:hypothetical protein
MNGYIAGPFQVVLGTHLFTVEIYVAPIEENVLLGLDFLEANGVSLCNVRGINSSPLVAAFTIYSPTIDSLSCAPTLMTELGGTLHPLARNTPASFSYEHRREGNADEWVYCWPLSGSPRCTSIHSRKLLGPDR